MASFTFSRLFPLWFSPPSKPPNPALSVDNVIDENIDTPVVEPSPTLSKTKTARAKRQEVSSSFDDMEMKDAAPNPTLNVDNNAPRQSKTRTVRAMSDLERQETFISVDNVEVEDAMATATNSEQIDRIISQTGQAKSTSIAPTTQDPFEEQPAIEKVKGWNRFQLLQWIQRKRPLEKDELENFEAARISGSGFLRLAGDVEFFKRECHLPVGPSLDLAELAREIAGGEIKQGKRKRSQSKSLQKTTLDEYLHDCHVHIFKFLQIADPSISSAGFATKVDGKFYPMWLRRWADFANIRDSHFNTINEAFDDKRLFPEPIVTIDKSDDACPDPAANEKHVDIFEKIAIERPVRRILRMLLEVKPSLSDHFNFTALRFSNNSRELSNIDQSEEPSTKRQQLTYPDGLGFRKHPGGDENLAFVFDYKAAHKFKVEDLKPALAKEELFMEVIQRTNRDEVEEGEDKADKRIAMALAQVFDYMIERGVAYGYVTAGTALVFLHVKQDDLRTMYYHLCVPGDDQNGDVKHTAVAQLTSLCLLTLQSEALQGSGLDKALARAKAELQKWPDPYKEAKEYLEIESVECSQSTLSSQTSIASEYIPKTEPGQSNRKYLFRIRSACKDAATARRDNEDEDENDDPSRALIRALGRNGVDKRNKSSSGSSSWNDNQKTSSDSNSPLDADSPSDSDSPPTRQYCTQHCLLGLKRGWDLDINCPNVSSHRRIASGTRHPINTSELASLVNKQLHRNPYRHCIALDPYGITGKIGAIGALFKLEVAQYGYTFVGKGTQSGHFRYLQHESIVYSRLERLQGEVVPVYLGIVNLPSGYALPGRARVTHMMLMSWGGEVAKNTDVPDLKAELSRSTRAVWSEGVNHGDERQLNTLWNKERRRVMLVDFNRATFRPAVKHKQLSKLSRIDLKRKR